jgi:hypothetical protein
MSDLKNNNEALGEILNAVNELPNANSIPSEAVLYVAQTLTDTQKAQARENIDALGKDDLQGAVNDALTQAKNSGMFNGADGKDGTNGKDGTSVTITKTTTSNADGGSNTVTFSDGKTLTVKNGSKGNKGDTPVKGVDYFTESDKAEIIQAVMDGIGCPVYGFIDENKNIILKVKSNLADGKYFVKGELEDGSIVDIGELSFVPEVTYTDLVPTAKGSDGSVLNGVGYKRDARWSTSAGTLTTGVTGYTAIGLSPITGGKPLTVYVYGLELDGTSYSALIANKLLTGTVKDFSYKLTAGFTGTTFVSSVEKLANYYYKITTLATDSTAAYFALCGKTVSSMTPIVTLNEPIM